MSECELCHGLTPNLCPRCRGGVPEKAVACVPVRVFKNLFGPVSPAIGTILDDCESCGDIVYVSPSSWIIIHENPGTKIMCLSCLVKRRGECQVDLQDFNEAQFEEIKEFFKRGGMRS